MSLYEEKNVKLEQQVETRSWAVRGVVQLLLHYGFLYMGTSKVSDDQVIDGWMDDEAWMVKSIYNWVQN